MILENKIVQSFIVDSYVYIFFLLITILLLFQKDKRVHYIFLSVLILFAGLRGGIGIDFVNYNKWYNITVNDNNLEIGYVGIMNVFAYFNLSIYHIQFLFFSGTLLFISLSLKKYTNNLKYAWFFYLIFPYFFLYSFILMRQYLAMAIVFWSFQFLLKNKLWHNFILNYPLRTSSVYTFPTPSQVSSLRMKCIWNLELRIFIITKIQRLLVV
jgi:hypothetical protein